MEKLYVDYKKKQRKNKLILLILFLFVIIMSFVCLFVGSSNISFIECIKGLFNLSSEVNNRIILNIRLPRVLACLICGAGLSISGLIMQTTLSNSMASPSTLGVSNAAVFGANLSIIISAGGFFYTSNNVNKYLESANPYTTSLMAFIFSILSILLILVLCKIKLFSPNVVILSGIAIGAIWNALTTILQYCASDVGLSSAVIWNFGDLSRATYKEDIIMGVVVLIGFIYFMINAWNYNGLLSGDNVSKSLGINVNLLRGISLLLASLICAVCVSFLGIIGFVGIICPHIMKRILGNDHRYLIPASLLSGSLLLLISDTISRSILNGSALPVGAITSLLGAPFFLYIIFSRKDIYA